MKKEILCSPATAATQFADNVSRPFWAIAEEKEDDFFDCYVSFKELDCQEYVWEWKHRKLDELLIRKLIDTYRPFFTKNQIGADRQITLKTDVSESLDTLGKMFMMIITSNEAADNNKMHTPPVTRIIYPAKSLGAMIRLTKLYNESAAIATEEFKKDCQPKTVSIMPVQNFEGNGNWYAMLNDYFKHYSNSFRQSIESFRPVIPRASIADDRGFVSAVLTTKRALASYSTFSQITGVNAEPFLDAGPLLFRGGLAPGRINEFISTYPGVRTVAIRPSFRYDYEVSQARNAISKLNKLLPNNLTEEISKEDITIMKDIEKIFTDAYKNTMQNLDSLKVFPEELGVINKTIDPSLEKTFALYSLGIPPELIGTGRGLVECIKNGLIKDLERFYPNIKKDLINAGELLNKENLSFLCKLHPEWNNIKKDVQFIEEYTDQVLGPKTTDSFLHRNHTSNIFHLWSAGRDFSSELMGAARARKCMG